MKETTNRQITAATMRYYLRAIRKYKYAFYISTGLMVITVLIQGVLLPFLYSQVFDKISQLNANPSLADDLWQLLVYIGISLFALFSFWRVITYTYVTNQGKAMRDLEQSTFSDLQKRSYSFFSDRFGGALVTQTNRFVNGLEAVQDAFFWDLAPMAIRSISFIIILLFVFPVIGFALLIWLIFFVSAVLGLSAYKSKFTRAAAIADSSVTAELADAITNTANIKIFGRRKFEQKRYESVSQDRYKKRSTSWFWDEHLRFIQSILMISLEFFVIYWSIKSAIAGTVSVGVLLLTTYYLFRLFGDFWEIGNITRRLEKAISDAVEMTKILRTSPDLEDDKDAISPNFAKGKIQFDNLFSNLSIDIKAGEKVGLVGPSGGGKTTITKLLLRFMDINSGKILIDDQDISELVQDELRRNIAFVSQEPILFHRSIRENIAYGNPDASLDEIKRVAKLAHAAEFIDKLPKGYETLVGERGMKLSGGQKQRVAIARAMLVEAPILLLDEATSALDSESEALIADALDTLMEERTTIVIAHRLSTIRKLDRIIVMNDGKIVEQGSHDDLLAEKGLYAKLWSHQSGDFLDE
jgi:ATP-binding cassette subfamily B protein